MYPSDSSLLLSIRRALAEMTPSVVNGEHSAMLRTIDMSLNELLLRQDNSFYLQHYHTGRALLGRGLEIGLVEEAVLADLPIQLRADASNSTIAHHTARLTERMAAIAKAIGSPKLGELSEYLDEIIDWERSLYSHRTKDYESPPPFILPLNFSRETLEAYLRQKFLDHPEIEVTTFSRIFGGYSKLTIMFSTNIDLFGGREFVIRAELASIITHRGGTSDNEFSVMRYAYEQGIRIPEPLWVELDCDKLGARFVVSRKAKGSIYGTTAGAHTQLGKPVLQDLLKELVKIHSVDIDPNDPLVVQSHLSSWASVRDLRENVLLKFAYWRDIWDQSPHSESPLIERCLSWMAANIPETDDVPSLVHGDYGLHNILIEEGEVSGVLDWEVTHFGDRAQDLSYLIICLTGTASRGEVLKLYEEAGGSPVSEERLKFYDVYYSFALLLVCNVALARMELAGQNPSLAEFGLRYTEFFADRASALISDLRTKRSLNVM